MQGALDVHRTIMGEQLVQGCYAAAWGRFSPSVTRNRTYHHTISSSRELEHCVYYGLWMGIHPLRTQERACSRLFRKTLFCQNEMHRVAKCEICVVNKPAKVLGQYLNAKWPLKTIEFGSFCVKSTDLLQFSSSTISDFDKIFPVCALMYWNMLCKSLQRYTQYSFLGGILKTSWVTPFIAICKSY